MLTERDESPHAPGTEMPERWQENMMVYGWDLEQEIGFFFHVQRIPARNFTEIKTVVCTPDAAVSGRAVVPMGDGVMYEGLVIEEPFRKTKLRFDCLGVAHDSDSALPALSDSGSVPHGVDLALEGKAGPADWFEPLSAMAATESTHYQMGGSFEGTMRLADSVTDTSGLYWRDHTWGLRNYDPQTYDVSDGEGGLHSSWFTPVILDEGRTMVNGLWIKTTDGGEQQFCVLNEGERTSYFDRYAVEVIEGKQEICAYDAVRVTGGDESTEIDCRIDVARHLPMYLPDHGPSANLSEAFGPATWGSRTGWGSAELMESTRGWMERPQFAEQLAGV